MWHSGPSKQRLWLGSRRHPCCGGRRYTEADAYCYGDSDRHGNSQPNCNSYGDSDRYANSHGNGDSHGDGDRHGDSDRHANGQPHCNNIGNSHATTDANAQGRAIRKAAPHASAEAIEFRRTGNSW